jgi:hypothetical protein
MAGKSHDAVVTLLPTIDQMKQTLVCPIMFNKISEKTLYIFGACNALSIPMVWALYPESNQRTLEEMDLLFAADTPWNWDAERNFKRLCAENPHLVQAAQRGQSVVDAETGIPQSRRASFAQVYAPEQTDSVEKGTATRRIVEKS